METERKKTKTSKGLEIEEDLIFREYGKFEYPIRYLVHTDNFEIYDTRSGKLLQVMERPEDVDVLRPLDGDHFLAADGVYSIPQGKKIQEIDDIKAFAGKILSGSMFMSLPTPESRRAGRSSENYEYTMSRSETGIVPFNPNHREQKLLTFSEDSNRIGIWSWTNKEKKKPKLVKEYETKFETQLRRALPLEGWKIVIFFDDYFIVYDTFTRETLKRVDLEPGIRRHFFLLPNRHLGCVWGIGSTVYVVDLNDMLNFKAPEKAVLTSSLVLRHPIAAFPEKEYQWQVLVSKIPRGLEISREWVIVIIPSGEPGPGEIKVIRTTGEAKTQKVHEIKINEMEFGSEYFVHGTDIFIVKGEKGKDVKEQVRVVDVLTRKTKQTFKLGKLDWSVPPIILPGNLYCVNEDHYSQLIKFEPQRSKADSATHRHEVEHSEGKGVYKIGRRFIAPAYAVFLPTSSKMKKALIQKLDEMLKHSVPKEVSGIIAGFI